MVKTNTYRHTLRQTHPFKVGIHRGHPFRVAAAAGVGYPRSDTVHRAFNGFAAAKRGNFRPIARTDAFQFGLFQIGHDVKCILFHQRHRRGAAGDKFPGIDVKVGYPTIRRGTNLRALQVQSGQVAAGHRFRQLMLNRLQHIVRLVNLFPRHRLDAKLITPTGFDTFFLG